MSALSQTIVQTKQSQLGQPSSPLPASGYLFIAFQTDNPGAWVMHCHIAWHVSEGLSLQLVERQSEIFDSISLDNAWESTCTNWNSWYNSGNLFWGKKTDSGL